MIFARPIKLFILTIILVQTVFVHFAAAADPKPDIDNLRTLALQGDLEAQADLGRIYRLGEDVPLDYAEAAKWYRLAADQGVAGAQFYLGTLYVNGHGVGQNYAEAAKWYRLAADQGVAGAQFNLGTLYVNGYGVGQNYAEAVRWYRLAADQGLVEAQFNLGVGYAQGRGVGQNYAEAAKWYRLAADQGSAEAQLNFGYLHYKGRGFGRNVAEAAKWFRLAADQGLEFAQLNLGSIYYDQGNFSEAAKWYRLSAAQGNADARMMLSRINSASQMFGWSADDINPDYAAYSRRQKTLIEEVLNYSTTGSETGQTDFYWIQRGNDECVVERVGSGLFGFGAMTVPEKIDVRQFNQTAFRIRSEMGVGSDLSTHHKYSYGDSNYGFQVLYLDGLLQRPQPDMSRLERAWGLAFEQCPGKKSRF